MPIVRSKKRMRLTDLIQLAGVELDDFKIHCATGANPTPLEAFFDGTFRQWQEHQNQKNFQCRHILSLIHLGGTRWLFAGVYEVLGVALGKWKPTTCYTCTLRERSTISTISQAGPCSNSTKPSVRRTSVERSTPINSTLSRFTSNGWPSETFPDSTAFCFLSRCWKPSFANWIHRGEPPCPTLLASTWSSTRPLDGKGYVGSAYGGDGIWQRWTAYAATEHGGNKELRALLKQEGSEHAHFFQFTLLEICDINSSDEYIIGRETHWKKALMSCEFRLNKNWGKRIEQSNRQRQEIAARARSFLARHCWRWAACGGPSFRMRSASTNKLDTIPNSAHQTDRVRRCKARSSSWTLSERIKGILCE